jgi:transcription initiation factor TFIIIB Brf1 subunit/transcription initiation factor TFIIB
MNEEATKKDVPLCPHCKTDKLVISQKSGDRCCWECGHILPDDFPSKEEWEFVPNPYGWKRKDNG